MTLSLPPLPADIFDSLPLAAQLYIRALERRVQKLETQVSQLQAQVIHLQAKVEQLENRLSKNSSNSHKLPSSDGFHPKTKSLRASSDKKAGSQKGDIGRTLTQVKQPDHVVIHTLKRRENCHADLAPLPAQSIEKRQLFDLPEPRVEGTEHQAEIKQCPSYGHHCKASFPEGILAPVQYGPRIQALTVYLSHQHFIPSDRLCKVMGGLFGISISAGTCRAIDQRLFEELQLFEENLKTHLK